MADDPLANAVETFSAPIEHLIIALGEGIAQAQRAMDQNSIQTQEAIDSDPAASQHGLRATWYQMPRVDLQLKLSLTVAQDQPAGQPAPAAPAPQGPAPAPASPAALSRVRLVAQPLSASFQTHFSYDAQAASQITLSIVPVPPPRTGDQTTAPPRMAPADVQAAALATTAKFAVARDMQGRPTGPAAADPQGNPLRFDVNFNGASRTWYVLQYPPALPKATPIVVAVDDATGAARVISTT